MSVQAGWRPFEQFRLIQSPSQWLDLFTSNAYFYRDASVRKTVEDKDLYE